MISYLFHTFFYNPIYNGLIFLVSTFPWIDLGLAVIFITIIVKLILFPLTRKSIETQIKIKEIEPSLKEIKEAYKNDKETQAKKTMELYKEKNINPFASFFLVLIQLPILFALYFVFLKGGLPDVNLDILYSFIKTPEHISTNFLHLADVSQKSIIFALLAGVSQYFQIKLVMPKMAQNNTNEKTLKDDLMRNMQMQMQYVMPIFITFIAYGLTASIALYWTTSNLFMIGQELYIRKNVKNNTKQAEKMI